MFIFKEHSLLLVDVAGTSLPSLSSVFLALTENIPPRELYMPGPKGGHGYWGSGQRISEQRPVCAPVVWNLVFQKARLKGSLLWTPWGWPTLPSEMVMRSLRLS